MLTTAQCVTNMGFQTITKFHLLIALLLVGNNHCKRKPNSNAHAACLLAFDLCNADFQFNSCIQCIKDVIIYVSVT